MPTSPTNPQPFDLRTVDPASFQAGDRAATPRAQALLQRIVDTPRTVSRASSTPARRRRRVARPTVAVASLALAAVAAVAVPGLFSTHRSDGEAFASWTPHPTLITGTQAADIQRSCHDAYPTPGDAERAAFTERRGNFTLSLVATDHAIGSCFYPDESLAPNSNVEGAASWSAFDSTSPLGPDEVQALRGGEWTGSEGTYTTSVGRIGSDVTAVAITAAGGPTTTATVRDGYYIAWWPGDADQSLEVSITLRSGDTRTQALNSPTQH
jgi:hypothetical protein